MDDLTWARRTGRAIARGRFADLVPQEVRDEWEREQDLDDWHDESTRRLLAREQAMMLTVLPPSKLVIF